MTDKGRQMITVVPKEKQRTSVGERFGRRVVLGQPFYARFNARDRLQRVVMQCDCGTVRVVIVAQLLKKGSPLDCGCGRVSSGNYQHGDATKGNKHWLYSRWMSMRNRAGNAKGYEDVKVCEEWNDWIAFKSWALANGACPELEIDRRDNEGHYEPTNCRWVTPQVNSNNRRTNKFIDIDGVIKTLAQWLRDETVTISEATYYRRLKKGWTPELALTTPC